MGEKSRIYQISTIEQGVNRVKSLSGCKLYFYILPVGEKLVKTPILTEEYPRDQWVLFSRTTFLGFLGGTTRNRNHYTPGIHLHKYWCFDFYFNLSGNDDTTFSTLSSSSHVYYTPESVSHFFLHSGERHSSLVYLVK